MASTAPATKPAPAAKTVTKKASKPSSTKVSSHPPYFQMIKEAILALREKGGSSPHAIAKHIEETHKAGDLPGNFKKILASQLKKSAAKGKLIKVKASYKLSEASKKEPKAPKEKKPMSATAAKEKKPKTAKTAKPKAKTTAAATGSAVAAKVPNKAEAKKKPAKKIVKKAPKAKATPMKRKAPKSIKSPAAKKAKKA